MAHSVLAANNNQMQKKYLAQPGEGRSYYEGIALTGVLNIGFNNYGALGIKDPTLGDIGFQYPAGYDYESLAVGWWGEGWSIFYDNEGGGFQPHDDIWGDFAGQTPSVSTLSYNDFTVIESRIVSNGEDVELVHRLYYNSSYKYVVLQTCILCFRGLSNVEYQRFIDWDVWSPTIGGPSNYWGYDNIRRPDLNMAVAFVNTTIGAPGEIYMGTAVSPTPTDYDLNGWDDYYDRGVESPVIKVSLRADGTTSRYSDDAVLFIWNFGNVGMGTVKEIVLVYAASETLDGLESLASEGLGVELMDCPEVPIKKAVGGTVEVVEDVSDGNMFFVILLAIGLIALVYTRLPK